MLRVSALQWIYCTRSKHFVLKPGVGKEHKTCFNLLLIDSRTKHSVREPLHYLEYKQLGLLLFLYWYNWTVGSTIPFTSIQLNCWNYYFFHTEIIVQLGQLFFLHWYYWTVGTNISFYIDIAKQLGLLLFLQLIELNSWNYYFFLYWYN